MGNSAHAFGDTIMSLNDLIRSIVEAAVREQIAAMLNGGGFERPDQTGESVKTLAAKGAATVKAGRRSTNRVTYWPTKAGVKLGAKGVKGATVRPVFAYILAHKGQTKRQIMDALSLTRGQTESAIYGLQLAGLVESKEA